MHGMGGFNTAFLSRTDLTIPRPPVPPDGKRTSIRIALKDWRVLHAVVDCGTFASAASVLHMSQPAVSYTVAKLEEQIGIRLFQQQGRKAYLTAMGKALVERSRALIREAYDVEEFALNLVKTWHQDIRLLIDREFPTSFVVKAIRQVAQHNEHVNVTLVERSLEAIEQALIERKADLVITRRVPEGMNGRLLAELHFVPVAHPSHPLFRLGRPLTTEDLSTLKEVRYVPLGDESSAADGKANTSRSTSVASGWQVHDIETATTVIVEGLAYGWLPEARVAMLIAQKKLKRVPLHEQCECVTRYYLVAGHDVTNCKGVEHFSAVLQESLTNSLSAGKPS